MKGLTLSQREEARVQVLNKVLAGWLRVGDAARVLGVSERHGWRLLAAYRKEGVAAIAHGNRGRKPVHAVVEEVKARVKELAQGRPSEQSPAIPPLRLIVLQYAKHFLNTAEY
jgi:transposase